MEGYRQNQQQIAEVMHNSTGNAVGECLEEVELSIEMVVEDLKG